MVQKSFFTASIFFFVIGCFSITADARRAPVEAGAVQAYSSHNGRFTVKVTAESRGGGPSSCQLLEGERVISETMVMGDPGSMAVSDNGLVIAMLDWGWYDEGGSEGVSFYDAKWSLIGKVSFGGNFSSGNKNAMKWVETMALSPDGSYAAIGEQGKKNSEVTLYRTQTKEPVWQKTFGFERIREIVISPDNAYLLLATFPSGSSDLEVLLTDIHGEVLWQKVFPGNFSWDIKPYLRFKENGAGFEIFDKDQKTFRSETFPAPAGDGMKKGKKP